MERGLTGSAGPDRVASWLAALDARHLADFTPKEVARALRALSSCYVERRARLAQGGALDSAGKRAAFALFYAPLHFLVTREILRALPGALNGVREVQDVGCGTGSAGAAWALESGAASNPRIRCERLGGYRSPMDVRSAGARRSCCCTRRQPGDSVGG